MALKIKQRRKETGFKTVGHYGTIGNKTKNASYVTKPKECLPYIYHNLIIWVVIYHLKSLIGLSGCVLHHLAWVKLRMLFTA